MNTRFALLVCIIGLTTLTACSSGESPTPVLGCDAVGDMTPDCRFQNPEDIVLIPDTRYVIVSQYGAMDGSRAGNIASYHLDDESIEVLFDGSAVAGEDASWGDENCAAPNTFSPHGIDLQQRDDGKWMLLVVNHREQETIEFFELSMTPMASMAGDVPVLTWRGCAEGPQNAYFNDVVGSVDGGFWVTHMMPKDSQTWATIKALLGSDSGFVYRWQQDKGFQKVAGSDGAMPNGIEKSDDESTLFINMYIGGEVRKLDLASGEVTGTTKAPGPDNITWSQDGQLLLASHVDSLTELTPCNEIEEGACGFAYEIVKIDPADMSRTTLIAHRGAPLGGVTVATDVGNELIMGTFAGDRIVRTPKPD